MRGVKIMVQNKCLGCDVCVCVCTWKGWEDKGVFVCISLCRAGDLSTVFTLDVKNQNQDICGLQKSMIQKENASHAVTLKKKAFTLSAVRTESHCSRDHRLSQKLGAVCRFCI